MVLEIKPTCNNTQCRNGTSAEILINSLEKKLCPSDPSILYNGYRGTSVVKVFNFHLPRP